MLRRIPVVVLTTSDSEDDVRSSYSLHANAYVTKPVDFERFVTSYGRSTTSSSRWFGCRRGEGSPELLLGSTVRVGQVDGGLLRAQVGLVGGGGVEVVLVLEQSAHLGVGGVEGNGSRSVLALQRVGRPPASRG